jgi:hypothetical protein
MIEDLGERSIEILTGSQQGQLLDADLDRGPVVYREARAQAVGRSCAGTKEEHAAHAVDAGVGEGLLKIGRGDVADAVGK